MTGTVSPLPPPRRPARSGEPWTEEDYETLVRMSAGGADLQQVAQELRRRGTAVLARARRMLPLEERGLPADRALVQLRRHLREDPAYDWAGWLATSPPPRPVEHTHVTTRLDGIPGLEDEDLLAVAECLVTGGALGSATRGDVLSEVVSRGLTRRLAEQVGEHLVDDALRSCRRHAPVDVEPGPHPSWDCEPYARPGGRSPDDGPWSAELSDVFWGPADEEPPWDA